MHSLNRQIAGLPATGRPVRMLARTILRVVFIMVDSPQQGRP